MNPLGPLAGIRLIDSEAVGEPYEDWSQVRSPGRAARRRKRGFTQRIVTRYRGTGKFFHDRLNDVIYIHPDDRVKIERMLSER